MGGALSTPSEEERQAMTDTQMAILKEFALQFPISFQNALINQCKETAEEEVRRSMSTRKLEDAEKASYPIMEGKMIKSGGTNWGKYKERYFIATNEETNYRIEYYPEEGGEKIANIECRSLYARRFNAQERLDSEFGVKMEPWSSWDPTGRTWYFRCSSAEDEDKWYDTLQRACYKAEAPMNYDKPVIAAALKDTLSVIARNRWIWINFDSYTEEECIAKFIFYVVHRDHLTPFYNGVDENLRPTIEKATNNSIYSSIMLLVKPAWATASETAQKGVDALTSTVQKGLDPLCAEEAKLLTKIGEITEATVGNVFKEITSKLFPNSMTALAMPIGESFAGTARGLKTYLTDEVIKGLEAAGSDKQKINEVQKNADRQVYWTWSGPLREATEKARQLPTLIQDDAAFTVGTGMSPWTVHWKLRDATKALYRAALNKFFNMHREQVEAGKANPAALIPVIVGEFLHDAPDCVLALYMDIFSECMKENSLWREGIVKPMKAAIAPLADVVKAIPVVNMLIDLEVLMDKCLDQVLESTLAPSVAESTGKRFLDIEALGKELDVDAAALA